MAKFWIPILLGCLLSGCFIDSVDTIMVKNESTFTMDVLINENYPDTTIHNTDLLAPGISPAEDGPLDLVNREWEELLEEKGKVTLFFVEHNFKKSGGQVYGKLLLSQSRLDSLGGEIAFPDDVVRQE